MLCTFLLVVQISRTAELLNNRGVIHEVRVVFQLFSSETDLEPPLVCTVLAVSPSILHILVYAHVALTKLPGLQLLPYLCTYVPFFVIFIPSYS